MGQLVKTPPPGTVQPAATRPPKREHPAPVMGPGSTSRAGQVPVPVIENTAVTRWVREHAAPWLSQTRTLPGGAQFSWSGALAALNRVPGMSAVFTALDSGAEAIERSAGFFTQMVNEPEETWDAPGEAWRAATLTYDLRAMGRWGASYTDLHTARNMLVGGATMDQVRDALAQRYGVDAAMEGMVQDALLHMVVDPINIVMPMIHPVQRVQELGRLAIWGRIDPARIGAAVQEVGDMGRAFTAAEGVVETTGRGAHVLELAGEQLLRAEEGLLEVQGKAMTPFMRAAVWLSGGMPLGPETLAAWAQRTSSVGLFDAIRAAAKGDLRTAARWGALPWNMFRLTPQSMGTSVLQELERYASDLISGQTDRGVIEGILRRAADAATAPRSALEAARLTPGGAAMGSWLQVVRSQITDLGEFMAQSGAQRADIALMSRLAGLTPDQFMGRLFRGQTDDAFRLLQQGITNPAEELREVATVFGQRLQQGLVTQETLQALGKVFAGMPYTDELYRIHLLQNISTATAVAVREIAGVRAGGFWMHAANTMKMAESLAYLGGNPGYYIRNLWNNNLTMIARGTWNMWSRDRIQRMVERLGAVDPRMFAGFGAAEFEAVATDAATQIGRVFDGAEDIIREAARFEPNWLDRGIARISGFVNAVDMRRFAANAEAIASARAYASAIGPEWRNFAQMGRGYSTISSELAEMVGEDYVRLLRQGLSEAMTPDELRDLITSRNLNLTMGAVLDTMGREAGISPTDIRRVFGEDFIDGIGDDVVRAMQTGNPEEVRTAFRLAREGWQSHIDDLTNNSERYARAFETLQVDGPNGVVRIYNEGNAFMNAAMDVHHRRVAEEIPRILDIEDEAIRGAAWRSMMSEEDAFFTRTQNWLEADRRGMVAGARRAGVPLDESVLTATQERIAGVRAFFRNKRTTLDTVFAMPAGAERDAAYGRALDTFDTAYTEMMSHEATLQGTVDRAVATLMPEGPQRTVFEVGRQEIRELRGAYMQDVQAAYRQGRRMTPTDRHAFFTQTLQPRQRAYDSAIADIENRLRAAIGGNPAAAETFREGVMEARGLTILRQRILSGQELTPDEATLLRQWRETTSPSPELSRLREEFGDFTEDTVRAKVDEWEELITAPPAEAEVQTRLAQAGGGLETEYLALEKRMWAPGTSREELDQITRRMGEIDDILRPAGKAAGPAAGAVAVAGEPPNIHTLIDTWVREDGDWKTRFAEYVAAHPEEAAEIQDLAQWWLREQSFDTVRLHGGKLTVYRGSRYGMEDFVLRPYDSFTSDVTVARDLAREGGILVEVEIPVENIFTHYRAHPAFGEAEGEFILNARGVEGARIVSVNGEAPTPAELEVLGRLNPNLVGTQPTEAMGFFPDARRVIPDQVPMAEGLSELWATDGGRLFQQMEDAAVTTMGRRTVRGADLSQEAQAGLTRYLATLEDEMPGVRMATMSMAAARRDASLLNYSRRTNFDTYMAMGFPFAFWTTHSVFNWMLHSIDRPAMLSTFLRMQRLMQMGTDRPGFPERMRGFSVPIEFPGSPEWLGPIFIDPLGIGLPFNQWQTAAESAMSVGQGDEERIVRSLDAMLQSNQITQEDHDAAIQTHNGAAWEAAGREVSTGEDGWIDAFSLLTSPHAPLMWAYNALRGRPFQPGPFLPATRTIRGLTAAFGIGPAGGINIEAPIRRTLGLPEFDEWDDYRIDRMLSTMAVEGYPPDQLQRAMIDRTGPLFDEAQWRAGQQYAVSALGSLVGIPTMAYPPGEEQSRILMEEFGEAIASRDAGNTMAVQDFFDAHPEAEVRLAINATPEERLQRFVVDQVWNAYNALPDYTRAEVREQFGAVFRQAFLDRDTRSYDSIPVEIMGMWARALGADTPGRLVPGVGTTMALELAPPQTANRIQVFYDTRDAYFPEIYDVQDGYFAVAEGGARRQYLTDHPELRRYFNWRNDWLLRNPDVAQFIDETPPTYPSEQAYQQAVQQQPNFQWAEWYSYLGPNLGNLVQDYAHGEELPAAAQDRIREIAEGLGITYQDALQRIVSSTGLATQQ